MIFKKNMCLKSVQNFLLRNSKVIHTDNNNSVFIDNIGINKAAYFYDLYQNQLIYDFKRKITFLDLISNQEKNIENKSIIKFDGTRYLLLTSKSNQEYCELSVYDLLTNSDKILEEKYYWGIGDIFNDNFYFDENKKIKSLSLLTGEYEWEVDLSEYGQIRSVLTAVEDNLWVLANDYKANRHCLLRLSASTGQILQVLGEGLPLSDAHVKYIAEKQTLLSFKSSISTIPSPSTLVEIDATTGDVLRNVTVESMMASNLKVGLWEYLDNQIFFTANTTMMTTTHIGVLDYDSLALLWYSEVPNRKGLLKDLQVTTDKLYVLDQVGTLHIFEKET